MGDPLSSLIGIWLFITIAAAAVGGKGVAGKVLSAPFRLGGWMLRGMLSAAGKGAQTVVATLWRGLVHVIADAHHYLYGHWPGAILLCYTLAFFAAVLYIYLR